MTIFTTPVLSPILKVISWVVLLLIGWRPGQSVPTPMKKGIILAAPHTSNWDFALFLAFVFVLNLKVRVLIKHTLFVGPLGWFLRYCGGIPVDRRSAKDYVKALARQFEESESFHLVVTPEGTRSARTHWKTGFYHIALAANVPVLLAGVNCKSRRVSIDQIVYPTGDLKADMEDIYAFYDEMHGIWTDNYASPNRPAPEDA